MTNKNERNKNKKIIELTEALMDEADKNVDEMDQDKIDKLVELIAQYDEDEHIDTSDYEEFLERFNAKNNTHFTSNRRNSHLHKVIHKSQFSKRCKNGFAVATIVLSIFVSAQALVIASTNNTVSSWVTKEEGNIIFHIENSKYKSWVKKLMNQDTAVKYIKGFPNIIKMNVEWYETTDINEVEKFDILIPEYVPEGYEFKTADIVDYDLHKGQVSLSYEAGKEEKLTYTAIMYDSDTEVTAGVSTAADMVYVETVRVNNFTAYIYQGSETAEAQFCYQGVIYIVSGTINQEQLIDVLNGLAYPE